jgi:hypothetical protein
MNIVAAVLFTLLLLTWAHIWRSTMGRAQRKPVNPNGVPRFIYIIAQRRSDCMLVAARLGLYPYQWVQADEHNMVDVPMQAMVVIDRHYLMATPASRLVALTTNFPNVSVYDSEA